MMMSKLAPRNESGEYVRPSSQFRNFVGTEEGNPYRPTVGRYNLYIGLSCPWAHRTLVVRALKGLEDAVTVSLVSPSPIEGGWVLNQEEGGCRTLADLYELVEPGYSGRCTVPVLVDKEAYNKAYNELFAALDEIDAALETSRYLCGDHVTLADVRLFTTLFRFDVVYYGLFKCNRQRIQDYKNLGPYLRDLYQLPGVADTCDLEAVKRDYYTNLFPLNPGGILPSGPDMTSLLEPHGRESIGKKPALQD